MLKKIFSGFVGDIFGSKYEFLPVKGYFLPLLASSYTDDTIAMISTIDFYFNKKYRLKQWIKQYPNRNYSPTLITWANSTVRKRDSSGNLAGVMGALVGVFDKPLDELLMFLEKVINPSHNHPTALEGAKIALCAVYLSNKGFKGLAIYHEVNQLLPDIEWLTLFTTAELDLIAKDNTASQTCCNPSVVLALSIAIQAKSLEDVIRTCYYVGGDVDTLAAIACAIYQPWVTPEDGLFFDKTLEQLIQDPAIFSKLLTLEENTCV